MKVSELAPADEGKRIKVTGVARGPAEESGIVDDTNRLMGKTGVLTEVNCGSAGVLQAHVEWEDKSREGPGSLSLASEDEVEIIASPLTVAEKSNAETLFRAALNVDLTVIRSREIATGKEVALISALTTAPGGAVGIIPLAVLITENPYELYENPAAHMEPESRVALPRGVKR